MKPSQNVEDMFTNSKVFATQTLSQTQKKCF